MKTERPRTVVAGRYRLEELIRRGGSEMVWRALDEVLARAVIVRLIRPELTGFSDFTYRFSEVARRAASAHHPGLVSPLDFGTEDGVVYLVREYIEGESLRERSASGAPLDALEAASIARQIRGALEAARKAGLSDRDAKPEDVILDTGGRVRLTDVGLSGTVSASAEPPEGVLSKLDGIAKLPPVDIPEQGQRPSWFRSWFLVPSMICVVGAVAIALGLWLGELQVGGPLGVRLHHHEETTPPPATVTLGVDSVSAFDPPPGDGTENDSGLRYVIDGAPTTVWKSENYFDGQMHKPGVGVLLDLGRERTVTGFRLLTPEPGFRFSLEVGDDPGSLADAAAGGPGYVAAQEMRESIAPATGRYVLIWITTVVPVPDGNRAEIADVEVVGTT